MLLLASPIDKAWLQLGIPWLVIEPPRCACLLTTLRAG
jgi:hypothetical protein